MKHDDRHVVINREGKLACKGWRGAPGSGFIWSHTNRDDWMWIFPSQHSARLFANMNGGDPVALSTLKAVAA